MKWLEQWFPWLLAGLVAFGSLRLGAAQKVIVASELTNPVLNILAISVGFLAAVVTYLLTADGQPAIKRLKTTEAFNLLVSYHWAAIGWGFFAALASLLMIAANKMFPAYWQEMVFHVWVFICALALLTFVRAVRLISRLLQP